MKPNKDTAKILTEAEELQNGVKGSFWGIVKKRFVEKITAMNDIMNIDISDPNLPQTLVSNQKVVRILIEMIKEIEGEGKSVEDYNKAFQNEKRDEYLKIIEDEG